MTENLPSFSQAYGYEDLPQVLKLGQLPESVRNRLWSMIYRYLDAIIGAGYEGVYFRRESPFYDVLRDVYLDHFNTPYDQFPTPQSVRTSIKLFVIQAPFNKVFDVLLTIIRHPKCPEALRGDIGRAINSSHIAYTFVDAPPTIMPRVSQAEAEAVSRAINDLSADAYAGARSHLLKAGQFIVDGKFNDSVRESIHAVESVARTLDDKASTSLGPALDSLHKSGVKIHPALKAAFEKIYGYTNDADGIRHAHLNETNSVDEQDALFMFGACASFTSYLIGKSKR
jgi:hypothetical protein